MNGGGKQGGGKEKTEENVRGLRGLELCAKGPLGPLDSILANKLEYAILQFPPV